MQELSELVYVLCTSVNHDLFSVYPWEYTVMKFAANLNLKEHQFFLLTLYIWGLIKTCRRVVLSCVILTGMPSFLNSLVIR